MLDSQGDFDRERAAFSNLAFHSNGAPVQPDKFLHEGQPDPGPFKGTALEIPYAMKSLEYLRQLRWRNADARIGDAQNGVTAAFLRSCTVTVPCKVNLNAFDSRFSTIFSHISRST